ncbi:MAG: MoxR family ATPase [Pseudomonadota bacterium]
MSHAEMQPTADFTNDETRELVQNFRTSMDQLRAQIRAVIVGQEHVVESLLVALLTGGHCLITGMPGTAKTLLVRTLASALGLKFSRIQFTPDLMPSDITGTEIIDEHPETGHRSWHFVEGPLFTNVLLADEINRTPPKTQSALLEAMQERSVTVRGSIRTLEPPFFVLATQNPIELEGTYPLPEAQLDRFVFNILLDHLDADGEYDVVQRFTQRLDVPSVTAVSDAETILRFQWLTRQVPVSETIGRYAVRLVRATRPDSEEATDAVRRFVSYGASVRATLFIVLAAKAEALLNGRYHVIDDDISKVAAPVLRHRVLTNYHAEADGRSVDDVIADIVEKVRP